MMANLVRIIFIILCIIIHAPIYSMFDSRLDSSVDHNPWISKKLLWTFLSPSRFKQLGDTYTMNVNQIHVKHPETGKTVLKTPRYQFMCNMYDVLPTDITRCIMAFHKQEQKRKELHAVRKLYMHSYELCKIVPRNSFVSVKKSPYEYDTPAPTKGVILRFGGRTHSGHFFTVKFLPLDGSQWKYDSFKVFGLRPALIDGQLGFYIGKYKNGNYVSKEYVKPYSKQFKMCWFESKFGFIVQDAKRNVYVFCSELNVEQMGLFLQSMPKISIYERAIAYDFFNYNSQSHVAECNKIKKPRSKITMPTCIIS